MFEVRADFPLDASYEMRGTNVFSHSPSMEKDNGLVRWNSYLGSLESYDKEEDKWFEIDQNIHIKVSPTITDTITYVNDLRRLDVVKKFEKTWLQYENLETLIIKFPVIVDAVDGVAEAIKELDTTIKLCSNLDT